MRNWQAGALPVSRAASAPRNATSAEPDSASLAVPPSDAGRAAVTAAAVSPGMCVSSTNASASALGPSQRRRSSITAWACWTARRISLGDMSPETALR